MRLSPTRTPPTVGRTLLVYSTIWDGPRPATVVRATGAALVSVNVQLDCTVDQKAIQMAEVNVGCYTLTGLIVVDTDGLAEIMPVPAIDNGSTCYERFCAYAIWPPRG